MTIPARYPSLIVRTDKFPEEEREAVFLIAAHALMLSRLGYSISAAIRLIEHCETLQLHAVEASSRGALFEWRNIAARDIAINSYHFCRSLEYARGIRAPSLRAMLDGEAMKTAERLARARFPDFIKIRDSVGHSMDFAKTVDIHKSHMVDGKEFRIGVLEGRTFTVTNDGSNYSFIVDAGLRLAIRRIEQLVFKAFMDAGILQEPRSEKG